MWKIYYKIIELRMKNLVYNISYYMITLFITDGNYYAACIKRRTKKPHRHDDVRCGWKVLCQNNRTASRLLL